jgi:UPF0755 protein
MRYRFSPRRRHYGLPNKIWIILFILLFIVVGGSILATRTYNEDLKPLSDSQESKVVTIQEGNSVEQIADSLENNHLIKSSWAFELYIHQNQNTSNLQAGTYSLSSSQPLPKIVSILSEGKVTTKLVTILPGVRIDQVHSDLINDGFSPSSVDNALNPALYSSLPIMAFKPSSANTLEGLLWPDSFQKDPNTDPSVIIKESLNETEQHLTPAIQAAFASEGLTTYQGITLASVIMQEVSKPSDQSQASQVFISRLKMGMMLGSDVTAYYGSIAAGQSPSLSYNSPYNTLLNKGLPPTPISNINASALNAAAHPASTNWLYFVTGDNGTTYFSNTLAQQQANTSAYCHKLCSN